MEIIRDLLIFIAVMFAMCIVLIVVVSNLPGPESFKTHTRRFELPYWRDPAGGCRSRSDRAHSRTRCALRSGGADSTHLVLVHVFP